MTTRIGTPYYVSPEVLKGEHPYNKDCDLWSLGVIVFFMLFGYPPFYAQNEALLFKLILNGSYEMPKLSVVSDTGKDFIRRLLIVDPNCRMNLD